MNGSIGGIGKLGTALAAVNRVSVYFSMTILTGISFLIIIDVLLRFLFNAPLSAAVEISTLVMPYTIFLPFAFALATGRHVRISFVTRKLPTALRKVAEAFVYLLDLAFFLVVFWYSWLEFWNSFKINEIMLAAIKLHWWIGKFAMPLGILLIAAQCILSFLRTLKQTKE